MTSGPLVQLILGIVAWASLIAVVRRVVVERVRIGSMSAGAGAAALSLVLGLTPWVIQATGPFHSDPLFALFLSVTVGLPAFIGFRSVLGRMLPPHGRGPRP